VITRPLENIETVMDWWQGNIAVRAGKKFHTFDWEAWN